jgi:hypothetical protein
VRDVERVGRLVLGSRQRRAVSTKSSAGQMFRIEVSPAVTAEMLAPWKTSLLDGQQNTTEGLSQRN